MKFWNNYLFDKFIEFLSIIKIYNLKFSEVAIIGDSMMDDVVCGNTIGVTTILLDQISKKEYWQRLKYQYFYLLNIQVFHLQFLQDLSLVHILQFMYVQHF